MEYKGILTKEADPAGTSLVDSQNGFNELIRLVIMWTVRYRWPTGARFAFSCYTHWAHILLCRMGIPLVKLHIQEELNQGDPLSMVLYGITLVPLSEEIQA